MASRNLNDLYPNLRILCKEFLQKANDHKIDALVTCTWRSNEEQEDLYALGRTKPGKIVTRARAGQSAHNFTLNGVPASKAFDIVPLFHGKPIWSVSHPSWAILGAIGVELGLKWYGEPGSKFKELPHFELKT